MKIPIAPAVAMIGILALWGGGGASAASVSQAQPAVSPCGTSCSGGGGSDYEAFYLSSGPNAFSNTVSDNTLNGFVYFNWGGRATQNSNTLITDTYNTVSGGGYSGTGYAYYGYLFIADSSAAQDSYRSAYDLCQPIASSHSVSGTWSQSVTASNPDQLTQEVYTGLAYDACGPNARQTPLYMLLYPN